MKKAIYIILFLLLVLTIVVAWIEYREHNFVKNSFISNTGIVDFVDEAEYHDYSQSFIKTIIPTEQKKKLIKQHHFEPTTENLKGKVMCPFIDYDNKNFVYYVDGKNAGIYGYSLYCLNKEDNTLIFYRFYGN